MTGIVEIDIERMLSLDDFAQVVMREAPVEITRSTCSAMDGAFTAAAGVAAVSRTYGLNTGFGPMLNVRIAVEDMQTLQYNLLRSHATGMGTVYSPQIARGVLLARLQSFSRNRSAVRGEIAKLAAALLNAHIAPWIPRKGGVGASGDLVQLAHLGLLLIGEGPAWWNDTRMDAVKAYKDAELTPLTLRFRDGLAIVNGTSAMTAQACLATLGARRLLEEATAMTAIMAEIIGINPDAYSATLNGAKRHKGQRDVATRLRACLRGSRRMGAFKDDGHKGLQEHYSIRCAPQILGPMWDSLAYAERIVIDELNSTSDNPVFDPGTGAAHHGGNFHGDYVAFVMDILKISIVKCTMLLERQLNFLMNDAINGLLPPFVNLGRIGLELGMQGAQFTATSTTAENQTLGYPMSLHSISCNKDNQDVVSMGANAAWLTLHTLDNAFDVAAIHAVALSQATEAAGILDAMAPTLRQKILDYRVSVPVFRQDSLTSDMLSALSGRLRTSPSIPAN